MGVYRSYWLLEDDGFPYPTLAAAKTQLLNYKDYARFSSNDKPYFIHHYVNSILVSYVRVSCSDGVHLKFSRAFSIT